MQRFLIAFLILFFSLAVSPAFAEQLSAGEIRSIVPGSWSGTYKGSSLVISVARNGTLEGRYAGIAAHGTWTIKWKADGARICMTFRSVITDTKCGELHRKGNNIIYGFSKRGSPRLWLKRS